MKEMRMLLRSVMIRDGQEEIQKQSGHCQVQECDGTLSFSYTEEQEGETSTVEILSDGVTASMKRRGAMISDFAFLPGERTPAVYRTPYGDFDMEIVTHSVDLETATLPLRLSLSYSLYLAGEESSQVMLEVRLR